MDILLPNKNRKLQDWSILLASKRDTSSKRPKIRVAIQTWFFSQNWKQTNNISFLQYFPKKATLNYIHNKNAESIYEKNENLGLFLVKSDIEVIETRRSLPWTFILENSLLSRQTPYICLVLWYYSQFITNISYFLFLIYARNQKVIMKNQKISYMVAVRGLTDERKIITFFSFI